MGPAGCALLVVAAAVSSAELQQQVEQLAARVTELEKPGSDSDGALEARVANLTERLAILEQPGSDSPDLDLAAALRALDARVAELEKPNTDSNRSHVSMLQELDERVAALELPNTDSPPGESPVAIAGLAVGTVALFATAASGFFPPSTRALSARREEKAHPAEKC